MTALYINGTLTAVCGEVRYISRRGMYPSELRFTANIGKLGDEVAFFVDGVLLFCGRIFSATQSDALRGFVAYDLLRYFLNRDTFVYKNMTAGELLLLICSAYGLPTGNIADTKMKISSHLNDRRTLFSIMESALTITKSAGYGEFSLYDGGGKIELCSADELDCGLTVTPEACLSFSVTESIDENCYNFVKLAENTDGGRKYHVFRDEDSITRFGKLGYFATLSNIENGAVVAKSILETYASPFVTLECTTPYCHVGLRGGSAVTAVIDGEKKRLFCERAEHVYKADTAYTKLLLSSV